jgi:hypothetical protein
MAGESHDNALEKSGESLTAKQPELAVSVEDSFSFLRQNKAQSDSQSPSERGSIDSTFGSVSELLKDLQAAAKPLPVGDSGFTPKALDTKEPAIGDSGFTPKAADTKEPVIGDSGFTPKGADSGSDTKSPSVGDSGFTPKAADSKEPPVGDSGFTPKAADSKEPPVGDSGFTPKGADSKEPVVGDSGFTLKGEDKTGDKGFSALGGEDKTGDKGFSALGGEDKTGDKGFSALGGDGQTDKALTGTGDIALSLNDAQRGSLVNVNHNFFPGLNPNVKEVPIDGDKTGVASTWTKDGESLTVTVDDAGRTRSLKSFDGAGHSTEIFFKDGQQTGIGIRDGSRTVTMQPDEHGIMKGNVIDSRTGREIEKVTLVGDKLVYENPKGEKHVESFQSPSPEHPFFKHQDIGKYDDDTGTLTMKFGDGQMKTSFDQGRTDVVTPGGLVSGLAANGDINFENKKTGEASVVHSDGTGVNLHPDGTVERFGPKPEDNGKEKLSSVEQNYLKKHPEIDHREFAEIHRKFHGDATKIDDFYKELTKLDSAHNLSAQEKDALRKDLIHHVAGPAEIFQGTTPSCNVTVVERQLAMTDPAKYAKTVVEAVSEGTIEVDGHKVKLDVNNLKMSDSSGRDLASRVFQTAALHAEFHPGKDFVNTPDGLGMLKPGHPNEGATEPVTFHGLKPAEIAEVESKLTGHEKAVTEITSADDLHKVAGKNGYPMNITVDASTPPFGTGNHPHKTNHVVTIVGEIAGPPRSYLVENQWGLQKDHSTPSTAISEAALVGNMIGGGEPGFAIAKGDHSKQYKADGSVKVADYLGQIKQLRTQEDIASSGH